MLNFFFRNVLFFLFYFCVCVNAQNNYKYHYEVVKMDSTFDERADLTMETYLLQLKQEKDKKMDRVIGSSKETLTTFAPQSPLSNLLVDMLFEGGNDYLLSKKMKPADLALLNFGGIRAALPQGKITVGDIYQISPFDNTMAFVFVKGRELKKVFEGFTEKRNAPLANVQVTYENGKLLSYTISGTPLVDERIYTIVTINFLAVGGDEFLSQAYFESILYLDMPVRDVFINEIRKRTAQGIEIESKIDDRVKILSAP